MRMARRGGAAIALLAIAALVWAVPAGAAGPVAGKVTNASAAPLAGIEVCAVTFSPLVEKCAQTDAGGEYSIAGSGPGDKVHFFGPENKAPSVTPQWYPAKAHPEEGAAVTEGEITAGIDAVMAQGAEIEGKVEDESTAAAIAGVEVCPKPVPARVGERNFCTHSDNQGEFFLRSLAGGELEIELHTAGDVNYVDLTTPELPVEAGKSFGLDIPMQKGVEIKGTVTEGGSNKPVEGLGPPFVVPEICAVNTETQARIKCTTPGSGGAYALPGVPAGQLFTASFAIDRSGSDSYIGVWWNNVSNFNESTTFLGSAGQVFEHTDVSLVRGEDLTLTPPGPSGPEPGPGSGSGGGGGGGTTTAPGNPQGTLPIGPPVQPRPQRLCRKGFRKVTKGGYVRCVKKKHHFRRHHHKSRHHW
jgi:hypothetical protein